MRNLNKSLAALAIAGVVALFWFATSEMASEKVQGRFSSWGYRIENNRFRRGGAIEIWNSRGLNIVFADSDLTIKDIPEVRWLSDKKAIYLHLSMNVKHDSLTTDAEARMLYDYTTSELYITSTDPLWREGEWAIGQGNDEWMREADFNEMLSRYGK